jgi:hypothetical protein
MFKIVDSLSFVFNCFCGKREDESNQEQQQQQQQQQQQLDRQQDDHLTHKIFTLCEKHRISILPVQRSFEVEDLYPSTNQVHTWNIFVVGKDKTYILSNTNCIDIENSSNLVNKKAEGVIPIHFVEFFEPVWDKTLSGKHLQFFMVYEGRTFLVDTYPFFNNSSDVIGACMFMRLFETLPMSMFKNIRLSIDVYNPYMATSISRKNTTAQESGQSGQSMPSGQSGQSGHSMPPFP